MGSLLPRFQRGNRLAAAELNAIVETVNANINGGRSQMDVRILRCVVQMVDAPFEICRADEAVYDIRLVELNTVQYEVDWERRYVPSIYAPSHMIRIPAIGSPGIAYLFGEGQYRRARYQLFDEHPARAACQSEGAAP